MLRFVFLIVGVGLNTACSQSNDDADGVRATEPRNEAADLNDSLSDGQLQLDESAFRRETIEYLNQLERQGFAGGLIIARGDTPLIHRGIGIADRSSNRPWSTDTVSTIGSITKQFTGASILALQQDGLLSVNDAISKYFSAVPEDKTPITLHHLLTHSAGLVDPELGDWDPIEREEYVKLALAQPLAFEPGTSYAYSNAGYSLLGAIVEKVSGNSYESYLRDRLLLPAEMKETGYLLAEWGKGSPRIAVGYRGDERWGTVLERPMGEDGPYWALRANGGIHSTTSDMWNWARALLTCSVLDRVSMEAYWSSYVDEGYGDSYYGYGWVVVEEGPGGQRLITHNGGNGIFFADMAIYPDQQVVMVLQTNVIENWPLAEQLLEIIALRMFENKRYPKVSFSAK